MSAPEVPSSSDAARAELLACGLAALALTVADAAGAASRPLAPSVLGLALLCAAGWPLGVLLAAPIVVGRGVLGRALTHGERRGHVWLGAIDAALLFVLAVYAQSPRALSDANTRTLLLGVALAAGAALRWAWHRFVHVRPRLERVTAAIVVAAAAALLASLRWNGDPWFRLALHVCLVVAFACAAQPWLLRVPRRLAVVLGASLVVLGGLGWSVLLPSSRDGRLALHHRSSHVRSWAYVFDRLTWDGGVGARARRDTERRRAVRRQAPRATRLHGTARGHDVLLLSVDSLRWDAIDELASLRAALGPHADFRLATSPAPATRDSLPATLRGRAVRELRIEPAPGTHGDVLWRDPSPTIAHVLTAHGYRASTIPTSNQSDPRIGIQSGFDTVWMNNVDVDPRWPPRSPFTISYSPGHEVAAAVLRLAERTPGPLLLWVHFMEPHYPYHWSATGQGPFGMPAFRRAVRYQSRLLAKLIRDLRRIRRRPAIVAIFGDHGEELGEHGGRFHGGSVHAEQSRVVFLLAAHGVPAIRPTAPVSTAAIPATIVDLLGLDAPPSMTIESLLPAMAGESAWPEVAVTEMRSPYRSATGYTTSRFRLIRDARHDVEQLFDLERDPYEMRDLAVERPAELESIRRVANRWDRSRE